MNKRLKYYKEFILIAILVVSSTFTLKDLFKKGFFTSHDGIHQVARLYHFDQAIKEGQLPVRYAGEALNGFGYPLFIFNYHTPWYIAEPLYKLTNSLTSSIKLTFLLTYLLSGIIMFLWQREYWGNLGGFLAAILYLWAPYRFSVIFVRGALGDATCFIFLPLCLWAIDHFSEIKHYRWVVVGSLSLALLLLSHAMIFFLFLPIIILYFLLKLINTKEKQVFLKKGFLMFLLAGLLSVFYWWPATAEKKNTVFKEIMNVHYQDHFPTLKQLIYSKWGYGFSFGGTDKDEMSFQVGIAQWLIIALSVILLSYIIIRNKNNLKKSTAFNVFFLFVFGYSIFLMLPVSSFVWNFFSRLLSLDFPFRLLFLSTFSASILAGFLVKNSGQLKWLIAIVIAVLAIYSNRNHIKINDSLFWTDAFYAQIERTTNTYDEYRPIWVDSQRVKERSKQLIEVKGDGKISQLESKPSWLKFQLTVKKKSQIIINKVYYPGWYVKINNKPADFEYNNQGGLINFTVNSGKYTIESGLTETGQRLLADIMSGATLFICLILFLI